MVVVHNPKSTKAKILERLELAVNNAPPTKNRSPELVPLAAEFEKMKKNRTFLSPSVCVCLPVCLSDWCALQKRIFPDILAFGFEKELLFQYISLNKGNTCNLSLTLSFFFDYVPSIFVFAVIFLVLPPLLQCDP